MEVSLFGHSLGGVISFDVLAAGLCAGIPVRNLFCVGSPLGFFLATRRLSASVRVCHCAWKYVRSSQLLVLV